MKILSLQLAVRRKAYSKRDKSLFLHYGFNYSALTDTGANWAALTTGLWAAPKLKVAYYQLVNATKINNFSTRQLSSHAATPRTWQSCRHYQRRQKKTPPESLFLTCHAGFRCTWRGRVMGMDLRWVQSVLMLGTYVYTTQLIQH